MRRVMLVWVVTVAAWLVAGPVWGADTPAPQQLPGEHSTIATSDGSIRDDELADHIADALAGKDVSDVKIFFQQCFGGGCLDDIERALSGTGIPWVAGSAANPDEPAWTSTGGGGDGSFWTDAFNDNQGSTGTVAGDINATNAADAAAPGNPMACGDPEHPQQASGNGGSDITWGSQAQVVVFAGKPDCDSINNDVSNMEDTFADQYYDDPDSNIYTSATGARSTQDLKDMITDACNGLDGGQFVLYIGDHGDTHFDADEFWNWLTGGTGGILADPTAGWSTPIGLHEGWVTGLSWMDRKPDDDPKPFINVVPITPVGDDEWQVVFNGLPFVLPGMAPGESVDIPVPWDSIHAGENLIQLMPMVPGQAAPLELENLELSSGPIALRLPPVPEPAGLCLLGVLVLGLRRERR